MLSVSCYSPMSASAVPMKQLSSPAHCCLNSLRTAFTAQSSLPFLSIPLRPIRIFSRTCLSSSSIHWRAFLRRKDSDSKVVPFVAQTSDWARQSEDQEEEQIDEKVEAELDWENQQPGEDIEVDEKVEAELDWENQQLGEDTEARGSDEGWEETSEGAVEDGNEVSADGQVLEEGGGEVYSEPPEEAKLFVGNIPYDIDSEGLAKVFEPAGFVEIAEVIYSRGTGQSRGFGFITMSTVEEAEKAVEMFHRYDLNGRLLTVNKAAPRGAQPPERIPRASDPSHKIYVGNLPWDVDDSRLGEAFRKYGEVVNARVIYERETNRSRGFGFVTMSNEEEMNKAVSALDGQDLGGRPLRVSVAEERPRPGSFF